MTDKNIKKEEKKETKVSSKVGKLVSEIAELSVMDLSELVKALQDKLGVSAAPVAAASPVAAAATEGAVQAPAAGANQTVIMTNAGSEKIAVIKALREINQNLTLMDAKGMTDSVPAEVLKDAKAEDAKDASDKLTKAGATVELK
ncbi:MAG: 50S ribosomal protein L7/L12 [Patescibacteria group bacterium]